MFSAALCVLLLCKVWLFNQIRTITLQPLLHHFNCLNCLQFAVSELRALETRLQTAGQDPAAEEELHAQVGAIVMCLCEFLVPSCYFLRLSGAHCFVPSVGWFSLVPFLSPWPLARPGVPLIPCYKLRDYLDLVCKCEHGCGRGEDTHNVCLPRLPVGRHLHPGSLTLFDP